MLMIRTRVAPSAIHGMGLIAAEFIPRGTPIWRLQPGFDHCFSPEELSRFPKVIRDHIRWFGFVSQPDGRAILSGDHACFMNHSPTPNTGALKDATPPITTVALLDIAEGEELTCDYFQFDADAAWKLGVDASGQV